MSDWQRRNVPATEALMRKAASVLLVRDAEPGGVEVFMMQRAVKADFGGLFVFPGGKVDDHDRHDSLQPFCHGRSDDFCSTQLAVDEGGIAYWVAAVRECFEECGVLYAHDPDGQPVNPDAFGPPLRDAQVALRDGEIQMRDACQEFGFVLALDELHYFSHWITPEGPPRRYDTRFFIAEARDDQEGVHDDWESLDSVWTRPEDALARHEAGEWQMIYPTLTTLKTISGYTDTPALMTAVRAGTHLPEWNEDKARQGMQRVRWD